MKRFSFFTEDSQIFSEVLHLNQRNHEAKDVVQLFTVGLIPIAKHIMDAVTDRLLTYSGYQQITLISEGNDENINDQTLRTLPLNIPTFLLIRL